MPDEPTQEQEQPRRRRPVLLAMLAAAALLVALAGSGLGGGSANGGTDRVTQGAPVDDPQIQNQQGLTHRGRHCRLHEQQRRQQQSGQPPV